MSLLLVFTENVYYNLYSTEDRKAAVLQSVIQKAQKEK